MNPTAGGSQTACVRPAQALYCAVWFLVYVDQGLLSSNGVTGTASTDPGDTSADAQTEGGLQASTPSLTFLQCTETFISKLLLLCHCYP